MFGYSQQQKDALHHNRNLLISALQDLNLTEVVMAYDGGGDSGWVSEIKLTPNVTTPSPLTIQIPIRRVKAQYTDGVVHEDPVDEIDTLENALEEFAMLWLGMHHPGWENNEGGQGLVTIDVIDNTFTLAHEENYTTSSNHGYTL